MKKYTNKEIQSFLDELNKKLTQLHKKYETYFWKSYMGQPKYDGQMNKAMEKRDAFRSNPKHKRMVDEMIGQASKSLLKKLQYWKRFFDMHQAPKEVAEIRKKIADIENKISQRRNFRKEGYIDPKTKKFKKMSATQMGSAMRVEPNEKLRKAYYKASEAMATDVIDEYIELIPLRNNYAQALGYADFYDYKVQHEDGMTKKELFGIFDTIYEKTKYGFKNVKKLEKKIPGLRKPWNFSYLMAGDFINEEDQYFQLQKALPYWGQSFRNMGIDMDGGSLNLDLVARKGKYSNGFCHWPDLVQYKEKTKIPGSSNFTCNAVIGQVGSGSTAMATLFHEGGHAAHYLNSKQDQVCMNNEYPPSSTAWAETQSMFLDSVFSSIEWTTRYAHNEKGEYYPFELFEKRLNKLHPLNPLSMMGIHSVMSFERDIYELKKVSKKTIVETARKNARKFFDKTEDSLWLLNVPHVYSFESSCAYHGYGLAELAVSQWRHYFYKKYGHIVDNKNVGKEMKKVWALAATETFPELVKKATGKKLSPEPFIKAITGTKEQALKRAKAKIKKMQAVKKNNKPIDLKSKITMVHGTDKICSNRKSFEDMSGKYAQWIKEQKKKS